MFKHVYNSEPCYVKLLSSKYTVWYHLHMFKYTSYEYLIKNVTKWVKSSKTHVVIKYINVRILLISGN